MKRKITLFFICFAFTVIFAFSVCCLFLLYPKKYEKEVLYYSNQYHISPSLVFAVMKTESGFREDAVSSAGAVGLMQIMPSTAAWLMEEELNLYDPVTNIEIGCKYLAYLQSKFLDIPTVLAAYNAGPNKVKVWIEDEIYGGALRTLRKTPYKETNDYVSKVLKAQKIYKFLYKI